MLYIKDKGIYSWKWFIKGLMLLVAGFIVITFFFVLYYRFFNPSSTALMKLRIKQSEKRNAPLKIKIKWVPYDKISIDIKQAVVISEDSSFLNHNGFNFQAIKNAYRLNKKLGINKYGASTISQQVSKNLFLWQGKSWSRKILEAYFTTLVELLWDKKRILEMYLNIIEYGDGIFGIENASNKFFGVRASEINKIQASLIAAVLPNPLHNSLSSPSGKIIRRGAVIRDLVDYFLVPYRLNLL